MQRTDSDDNVRFPANFFDIGQKSFEWVFDNKKTFIQFTLKDMDNVSGFFKTWKDYVIRKTKPKHDKIK